MSGIAEYGPTIPNVGWARVVPTPARLYSLWPRWCYGVALVVGFAALIFCRPAGDIEDVARLERLIPKIERTQALSPEARDAVNRLVARHGIATGSNDQSLEMRRKAAIERTTAAMNAKDISSTGSGIDRRHDE